MRVLWSKRADETLLTGVTAIAETAHNTTAGAGVGATDTDSGSRSGDGGADGERVVVTVYDIPHIVVTQSDVDA